ncbi:MAG: hypothetical protein JWN41_1326, partial [Thermoleophilia bacterium]|nr:hypothetical protein [Thermoleophilia bacterium]
MTPNQHIDSQSRAGSEAEPAGVASVPPAPDASLLRRAWEYFVVYLLWRQVMNTEHPAWERFFARRCPHLAGMVAYFGVLS